MRPSNLSRALQGVGGAAMFAVSLALVAQEFPAGRERGTAMGIYGATIGVAVAVGPLVGGALTDALGWESVFYLNVPIGLAAIAVSYLKLRESRDPARPVWTGPGWRPSAARCSCWCWPFCAATTRAGAARGSCRCSWEPPCCWWRSS